MINAYGQLAVDPFPLDRFGLADKYPKIAKLQREVSELDARRLQAERELVLLRQGIVSARAQDAELGAVALRAGKDMPKPKHEAEAAAKVEGAERTLEALQKAASAAAHDLTEAQREHAPTLARDLAGARAETARRLSERATALLSDFALFHEADATARRFAPPAPAPDENAPATNVFMVARAPLANPGPQRGEVEAVLGHLAGLASAVPAEPNQEQPDHAA